MHLVLLILNLMPVTYTMVGGSGLYTSSASTHTNTVFNVLTGDLLVLGSRSIFANITGVVGTLSGTWTKAWSVTGGSVAEVWYGIATAGGSDGITVTGSNGSFIFRGCFANFRSSTGFLSFATVLDTTHTGGPTSSTSFSSGSLTTATATELLIGYNENETADSPTITPTGGWTAFAGNGVSQNNAAMYWLPATAAGSYSFAGTISSVNWITGIAAFKPVPSGGGGSTKAFNYTYIF